MKNKIFNYLPNIIVFDFKDPSNYLEGFNKKQ